MLNFPSGASMATTTLISVEEYVTLPVRERGHEYDEGRVIELSAQSIENAEIQSKVVRLLGNFIDDAGIDMIVAGPTGFWLTPQVERIPDACLIVRAKARTMEKFHGSLRGAPDVAIEIISPSESATELDRKVNQFLAAGVAVVILIYPETQHVHVFRPSIDIRRLGTGDVLELPELLPGLKVPIDDLFTTGSATSPA